MRIEVKASDLTDVDVHRVSMVKNASNRIPFRLTKGADGKGILDLSKLFTRTKKSADAWNANEGTGAVDAQEALQQAKDILERAGFTVAIAADGGQKQGVPSAQQANAMDDKNGQIEPTQQDQLNPNGNGDVMAGAGNSNGGAAPAAAGGGHGAPVINMHFHGTGGPAKPGASAEEGKPGDKPGVPAKPGAKPGEGDDQQNDDQTNNQNKGKPPMSNDKNPKDQQVQKSDAELAAEAAVTAAQDALKKAEDLLKAAQKSSPAAGEVNNDGKKKEDLKGTGATDTSGVGVDDKEVVADAPAVDKGNTSGPGGVATFDMLKKMSDDMQAGLAQIAKSVSDGFKEFGGRIDKVEASVKKTEGALKSTVVGDAQGDDDGQGTRVRKSHGAPAPLDTGMGRRS